MDIYIVLVLVLLIMTVLFFWPFLIVRYIHRRLWGRLANKYGWKFDPGKLGMIILHPRSVDRLTGTYRGRKFQMTYTAGLKPDGGVESGDIDFYVTAIQVNTSRAPEGNFRLDQKKLLRRKKGTIGDPLFDRTVRVCIEKPKGFMREFLADPVLRRRVSDFFGNAMMDDRKISLTPMGKLKLHDTGLPQSEKRLLKNLELLSDLAEVVENGSYKTHKNIF